MIIGGVVLNSIRGVAESSKSSSRPPHRELALSIYDVFCIGCVTTEPTREKERNEINFY